MGLQLITTVFSPAVASGDYATPYDIIDLTLAREELKLPVSDTSSDKWLVRAASQVSAAVNNYCNRVFQVEGLTDLLYLDQDPYPFQTPGGVAPLQLSRWPVVDIATVATSADAAAGSDSLSVASLPASVVDGQPASGLNIAALTVVDGVAGGAVTLSSPISAEIPAGTPVTFGFAVAQTMAAGALQTLIFGKDYALDPARGHLSRLNPFTGVTVPWEALPTTVSYYAGYAAVPQDVVEAALRLLVNRFFARGRDPNLREQDMPGVGRQTWWVGGPPKSGGMPVEVADLLDRYRVPVIG